jgi:hypothetical protein
MGLEANKALVRRLWEEELHKRNLAVPDELVIPDAITHEARQAADPVRGRIDWKYLLGLPLADPGVDFTILSDFRARLVQGEAEQLLPDALLDLCKGQGLLYRSNNVRHPVAATSPYKFRLSTIQHDIKCAMKVGDAC